MPKKGGNELWSKSPVKWLLFLVLAGLIIAVCCVHEGTGVTNKVSTQKVQSSSQKPTLMYFMASWCPSCASEEQVFKQIHKNYGNNIHLMTVDVDPKNDTKKNLSIFQQQFGGNWTHIIDKNYKLASKYKVKQLEEVFLINSNQKIVLHAIDPSFNQLKQALEKLGVKTS